MALRISEVVRLVAHRRVDGILTDDEAVAMVLADAMILRWGGGDLPRLLELLPDIDETAALRALHAADDIIARKGAGRYRPMSGEAAGQMLRLELTERTELRIRTLEAFDETADERHIRRRARKLAADRDRKRTEREGKHIPRDEYRAKSLSATKPWEAEGVSRRTWERRRKKCSPEVCRTQTP